jgi:hypothetical protein
VQCRRQRAAYELDPTLAVTHPCSHVPLQRADPQLEVDAPGHRGVVRGELEQPQRGLKARGRT